MSPVTYKRHVAINQQHPPTPILPLEAFPTSLLKSQSSTSTLKTASRGEKLVGAQLPRRKSDVSARALLSVHTRVTKPGSQSSFMSATHKRSRFLPYTAHDDNSLPSVPACTNAATARPRRSTRCQKEAIVTEHSGQSLEVAFIPGRRQIISK